MSWLSIPAAPARGPFKSTTGLAWATVTGLGILALGYLIEAGVGVLQAGNPDQAFDTGDGTSTPLWMGLQGLFAFFRFGVFVYTAIVFLIWLARSCNNLKPLRAAHLEYDSSWAIGWWFVPFANLVKPYQVVREVWRESDPDFDPRMGFLSNSGAGGSAYLGFWWFFWITSNLANNITLRVYDPDKKSLVGILGVLFTVTGVLSFGAAITAIIVVLNISKRQRERSIKIAAMPYPNAPEPPGYRPPPPPNFGQIA